MNRVGLVLGGGGVTGAAFHFGVLSAIEMATGWKSAGADVIIGTSSGAVVAAIARGDGLDAHGLVGDASGKDEFAASLQSRLYRPARISGWRRWIRHGILPGVRRPGMSLVLGSPARYHTDGIVEWLEERAGGLADSWPVLPTVIVAYDLAAKKRVAFGTTAAPEVPLKHAVAASAAVPVLYQPVRIGDRHYIDGGVSSGTSADLLLGNPEPLDFIIVIAPVGVPVDRPQARFYEPVLDQLGRGVLESELRLVTQAWPQAEVLLLQPDDEVLDGLRHNPLSPAAAVPAFLKTLRYMHQRLAEPEVWDLLSRHLSHSDPEMSA